MLWAAASSAVLLFTVCIALILSLFGLHEPVYSTVNANSRRLHARCMINEDVLRDMMTEII